MTISIDEVVGGTHVSANIPEGVIVLWQNSGTGKTYFFTMLSAILRLRGIKFCVLDYKMLGMREDILLQMIVDNPVVLLDNADLYLTNRLLTACKVPGKTVIISLKDVDHFDLTDTTIWGIGYTGNRLTLDRRDVRCY